MTMSDDNGIMFEEIKHLLLALTEGQESMANVPSDIAIIKNDIELIKSDNLAIKAVNRSESTQLDDHEGRITTLETL